jgi:serine phosphatase RsbU (regulator of sigma subunit)
MRAGRIATWVVSVFVALYGTVFLVQDLTKVDRMCRIGDIWSLLRLWDDTLGVFTEVDFADYVSPPYPEPGDTLVSVAGLPGTVDNYFSVFSTETPAGFETEIVFKRPATLSLERLFSTSAGVAASVPLLAARGIEPSDALSRLEVTGSDSVMSTTVRTRTIPTKIRIQIIAMFALRVLISAGLVAVGLWAFIRKPDDPAVVVLTLFCYALLAQMVFSRVVLSDAYASFTIPGGQKLAGILGFLGSFTGPLWLHLQLLFPRPRRLYARHRTAAVVLIYAPTLANIALILLKVQDWMNPLTVLLFSIYYASAIGLLLRTTWHADTMLARRQARLVLWGSTPGFVLLGLSAWLMILAPGFLDGMGFANELAFINLQFLLTLLAPVSIAYALGRYRLLDVESRYRRGTMFVFVNVFLLAVFIGVAYGAGRLLSMFAGIEGTTPALIISLSLAVGFAPAQRRLRNVVEDRFYPERKRLRAFLHGFLEEVGGVRDRTDFWRLLDRRLAEGLEAVPVIPVVRSPSNPAVLETASSPTPFRTGDELVKRLCTMGRPLLLDEIIESGRIPMEKSQKDWFVERDIALLIPLGLREEVLGFVAVGRKTSGEDFKAFELDILTSLSVQFAMAAENIELLEQKVEKEKLQEQLSIARAIQRGLLPVDIPPTPGLDVAANIQFCLEVAGDYYDVVPVERGRTLLAVGDVTGKGVGPALLMANLQASLRSVTGVGLSLPDLMGRVNRQVCSSTSSEYFITMFSCIFDPASGALEWVNAGHNPPLLHRAGGTVERLCEGGLLLGVSANEVYRSGRTSMEPGDLLLLYSDGVTEAMDSAEEEYGEDRLTAVLRQSASFPAEAVVGAVAVSVRSFHGADSFTDDFTVMAARRV